MPKATAVVLLAEGFEEIEAAAPIDVLRRAEVETAVFAVGERTAVAGAHGLTFMADGLLANYGGTPDLVVLPGGMPGAANLAACAGAKALCERVRAGGGWVAALCASPAVALGPWGFLAGKRATAYPSFVQDFPADATAVDAPVVVDGRLVTGRGPGAALAFALQLAAALCGDGAADHLRRGMVAAE